MFVGFASATAIEETDGAVVSQLPVVHVTATVSVRLIGLLLLFTPEAVNVTVPEPDPGVDELTVTVEDTLPNSVLLAVVLQVDGIEIVFGESIAALRAAFPDAAAVTVTVELFLKTFGRARGPVPTDSDKRLIGRRDVAAHVAEGHGGVVRDGRDAVAVGDRIVRERYRRYGEQHRTRHKEEPYLAPHPSSHI